MAELTGLVAAAKQMFDDATAEVTELQKQLVRAGRRRAEAVAAIRDNTGWTYNRIGEELGVTGVRAQQMVSSLRIDDKPDEPEEP